MAGKRKAINGAVMVCLVGEMIPELRRASGLLNKMVMNLRPGAKPTYGADRSCGLASKSLPLMSALPQHSLP